jgi:AraC-like DNA-binding protein
LFISSAIIRSVIAEAARYGVSEEALLEASQLERSELEDATGRVSLRQAALLTDAARELSGRPDLGLRVGVRPPTRALHVVGHVLVSAKSLRESIALFFRYAPLVIEGATFDLIEQGDTAIMRYEHPAVRPFAAELTLSFMYRIGLAFAGEGDDARVVRFRHSKPSYAEAYERVFGCPVEFDQPHDEIAFSASRLDVEIAHADDQLYQLLQRRADELLVLLDAAVPVEQRIRELLAYEADLKSVSMVSIAARLGTGTRSLRRKLHAAGVSWSELVDHEQRTRACNALKTSSAPIKQLSYKLGFSEPSAFHRAFKRWTGLTPIEYRRRHRVDVTD